MSDLSILTEAIDRWGTAELARKLEVQYSTVWRWEKGKSSVSKATLLALKGMLESEKG